MADPQPPLDSPALGTGHPIRPCGDALRPAEPAPPASGPPIGVTLSGGGFRATFAAMGVVRYLADAGLLGNVRFVSSVSGGSVANGILARHWPALRERGFATSAVDELLVDPLVERVSDDSLKVSLLRGAWRLPGRMTRTDLLAKRFDEWFLSGMLLEDLDPEVRFVINAANIVTGVRFGFERDVVGDYVSGLAPTRGTGLRVAQAVAASAAVPGAFAAWELPDVDLPCAEQAPVLLDGGVYDNTGLEVLDGDRHAGVFTVTINAGGLLRPGPYGRIPVVRDLTRANALLYRQSTSLRTRMMVAAFQRAEGLAPDAPLPKGARRGVLFALATTFGSGEDELERWRARFPETRTWKGEDLAFVPTVFDKLPEALCRRLVYRGWWLSGAAVAAYHPHLAPAADSVTAPPSPADA
ncbi:MAG TPA: patatin-like phospholipase family protein [Solirubrobacteraceae bacterium]|nr:patatin-like phospholipase family protein [Solirubrobacteraceae bacterium]